MNAPLLDPGLYIVATPIGNLSDITLRALDVLARVDLVACEDTRVTARLLRAHGIEARRTAYHEHNAARVRPGLIRRLAAGGRVALVSDAGTPLVSDPGFRLVEACVEHGIAVTAVPGPSAVMAALTVAGLPTDRFLFAGFLPPRSAARRRALAELAAVPATLVFFETGPRLADALADMAAVLGDRPAAVARELTKLYEETMRGGLADLAAERAGSVPPKGEIVIVVGRPEEGESGIDLDAALGEALAASSLRDAVDRVAAATGLPRRRVYVRALELTGAGGSDRTP